MKFLLDAFMQSDILGKAITLGLLGYSVIIWGVVWNKRTELRNIRKFNRLFLKHYQTSSHPISLYVDDRKLTEGSHLIPIFESASEALLKILSRAGTTREQLKAWDKSRHGEHIGDVDMNSIRSVAERELAEQQVLVEKSMSTIATAVSVAPSVGLFGTVLGVMSSFMSMATAGSAMISAVAPGISAALLTTVVGLVVAIPASVAYNSLADKVRAAVVEMENFVDEFMSDVSRVHG